MNVLLDTNVLLRFADPTHPQYRAAADATDLLGKQGDVLCLVPQNFYEFWVVSTRPVAQNGRGLTPDEVLTEFAFLDAKFTTYPDTAAVFDEWRQLMALHKVVGKPAHDARLVAAMLAHGLTHLLTSSPSTSRTSAGTPGSSC